MSDQIKKLKSEIYDLKSEEGLLSHICNHPLILVENQNVSGILTGERKELSEIIYSLASSGEQLSEDSLLAHKADEGLIKLFLKLSPSLPKVSAKKLIESLRDTTSKREVAKGASEAFSSSSDSSVTALESIEMIEKAAAKARSALQGHETTGGVSHVSDTKELIEDIVWRAQNAGKVKGTTFGFQRMETILDGLQAGCLYLIGARPSVGKTALMGNFAVNLANAGIGSMIFSCEMSKLQLQQRILATLSGVNPRKSLRSALIKSELDRLKKGIQKMKTWSIEIDDTDRINIELLRSRARHAVVKEGVKVIFVDYIGLIKGVEAKSRNSKREEVGEVSGGLKALSKELGVPVIALAQLKRTGNAYNGRSGETEAPRPTLESLKESGDLEQDADAVILLHRTENETCAIIAKNRNGECGQVELSFQEEVTSFTEASIQPIY